MMQSQYESRRFCSSEEREHRGHGADIRVAEGIRTVVEIYEPGQLPLCPNRHDRSS